MQHTFKTLFLTMYKCCRCDMKKIFQVERAVNPWNWLTKEKEQLRWGFQCLTQHLPYGGHSKIHTKLRNG